jgi:RNA 2',3'-cyclic 3'-phosphodiesterase
VSGTRSFVAIELSNEVRERLHEVRSVLVTQAPAWRDEKWVAGNNLHITVKFLGDLGERELAAMRAELGTALAGLPLFDLGLGSVRAVPGRRRCSMIWAQFDDPEGRCADLAAHVERAAVACGVPAEERGFKPHVTLVRARRPKRLAAEALTCANDAASGSAISMSVLSVTLFASTLTRTGPVYEAIDSWALAGLG